MIATLKHFPGHGDTDVDSHLGLPVIKHPRERLDKIELPPFKAGHRRRRRRGHDRRTSRCRRSIRRRTTPTTLSAPIVTGVLRKELGFDGLIYTDSMGMAGVTEHATRRARPPSAPSPPATTSSCIRRTMARRSRRSGRR